MKIIDIKNISKSFIKTVILDEKKKVDQSFYALNDISFSLNKGEILGILGPNGAGKTTLLRMISGLMSCDSGTVYFKNNDISKCNISIKSQLSYISNNTKLYNRFTPRELFFTFGGLYGLNKDHIKERIDELVDRLDLSMFIDNKIESLSTGQYQRVNIARCLIHNPDLYILDEPTLGLDIISSNDIVSFMKSEKEEGKSIIYSTHYMEEAELLCDRIILLYNGKIILSGRVDELLNHHHVSSVRELFFKYTDLTGGIYES